MGVAGALSPRIRRAGAGDLAFLREMLYEVVYWDTAKSGPKPPQEEVLSWPGIARYLENWGRPGDFALIAEDPSGRGMGAAWYRLMPPEDPGYGFVDAATPELAVAVLPEGRGRGAGEALLRALMDAARSGGFRSLSLSVQRPNPAVRLYERLGFETVSASGDALTMKACLRRSGAPGGAALRLSVLPGRLAVCRLGPEEGIPAWAASTPLCSITRTADGLSVVCPEERVPDGVGREGGWRALELGGPFELSEVGVLASVAAPLAEAGLSILALSTYDTDYVLVREDDIEDALSALRRRGHGIHETS